MRRSLAPSQQLPNVVTKKQKLSSTVEKENEDRATNTLKETLMAIRKPNLRPEPNNEVTGKSPVLNTPGLDAQSSAQSNIDSAGVRKDSIGTTRVRNNLLLENIDTDSSKASSVDNVVTTTRGPFKPKFYQPKRFISPLLAEQSKDTTDTASHSGDVCNNSNSITSHYYSVVW